MTMQTYQLVMYVGNTVVYRAMFEADSSVNVHVVADDIARQHNIVPTEITIAIVA